MSSSRKVAIVYKNFAANKSISHIGLGVAAINTSKALIAAGIPTEVWPIVDSKDLELRLQSSSLDPTHVIISAPWIPMTELGKLTTAHQCITFAVNCHSNVGFLQADANGVTLLRACMDHEAGTHNFHLAGNSQRFSSWLTTAYGAPCRYLPNLYYLDGTTQVHRPIWHGGPLRIGAFGATRPLKNFMSAAGSALVIARSLKANVELHLSVGRVEGGGDTILRAAKAMLDGLPNIKLVEAGWAGWPTFRQLVGSMHLLLQPSYTESFNMVTADGVQQGVPSVVSSAIHWAPRHWKADIDDVSDIARAGCALLRDHHAAADGLSALKHHNDLGLNAWKAYLGIAPSFSLTHA